MLLLIITSFRALTRIGHSRTFVALMQAHGLQTVSHVRRQMETAGLRVVLVQLLKLITRSELDWRSAQNSSVEINHCLFGIFSPSFMSVNRLVAMPGDGESSGAVWKYLLLCLPSGCFCIFMDLFLLQLGSLNKLNCLIQSFRAAGFPHFILLLYTSRYIEL